MAKTKNINIKDLEVNRGQIVGLPKNPRFIRDERFEALKKSIEDAPEMLSLRELLVYPHEGKYIVIGGNMRLRACMDIGYKEVPCKVLDEDTPVMKLREYSIKDNEAFGQNDWDILANEWDMEELQDWGMELSGFKGIDEESETTAEKEESKDKDEIDSKLIDRYIVPPFSVLDTRQGYWQDRKREWLNITGNLSETRNGEFGTIGGASKNILSKINEGTSNFDPVLAEVVYTWFCPKGGKILDPFGGEQTKGVVAGEKGLFYEAVEFRGDQVELNIECTKQYNIVKYHQGDSEKIDEIIKEREFDLCFTSPPYYDLEVYSKEDMSALGTYDEFMNKYRIIFQKCYEMMNNHSFLVVKVSEIRDEKGVYRNFVGDNIMCMTGIGFKYYNEIILVNSIGTAPIRAGRSMNNRKIVRVHQNVLVFYKGDVSEISKYYPKIEINTDDEY